MNEIRIRALMKRTGCGHELHTSFCRKQQSKIEVRKIEKFHNKFKKEIFSE